MLREIRMRRRETERACYHALVRYQTLAEVLGEVIEDLPRLRLPEAEAGERNALIQATVGCATISLISLLIGVSLPFSMAMLSMAMAFGVNGLRVALWYRKARRETGGIILPLNETKALELIIEQLGSVADMVERLQRTTEACQQQMAQFQQKIAELNTEKLTHAECTAILFNAAEGKIFLEIDFSPDGCGMCSIRKFDVASEYPEFLTWIKSTRRICREGLAREGGPYL